MIDQAPGVIARPQKGGNRKKASPPSPSRIPNGAGSSRPTPAGATYGNGKRLSEAAIMASADSELKAVWLAQQAAGERMLADAHEPQPSRRGSKRARKVLLAAGVPEEECAVMLSSDASPDLQRLRLAQLQASKRAEAAEQKQRADDQRRMKTRQPAARSEWTTTATSCTSRPRSWPPRRWLEIHGSTRVRRTSSPSTRSTIASSAG